MLSLFILFYPTVSYPTLFYHILFILKHPFSSYRNLSFLSFPVPSFLSADDVHRLSLAYVASCVEMSVTYKVIKPHMDFILFSVIFPTLCLSVEDIRFGFHFFTFPQIFLIQEAAFFFSIFKTLFLYFNHLI